MCHVKDKVWITVNGKKKYIDRCMVPLVKFFECNPNYDSVMCCCGHGKYRSTFLIKSKAHPGIVYDILSGVNFPEKSKYYRRKKGSKRFFFIPEIEKHWESVIHEHERDKVQFYYDQFNENAKLLIKQEFDVIEK